MVNQLDSEAKEALEELNKIEKKAKQNIDLEMTPYRSAPSRGARTSRKKSRKRQTFKNRDTEEGLSSNMPIFLGENKKFRNKFLEIKATPFSSFKENYTKRNIFESSKLEKASTNDYFEDGENKLKKRRNKSVQRSHKRRNSDYLIDGRRDCLPAPKPKSTINVFKILKDALGKDLSRF